MENQVFPQKTIVIGSGPAGGLAAIYAARRGDDVEVYDLRPDPFIQYHDQQPIPNGPSMSINMALSERGLNAIRYSLDADLNQQIMDSTVPMFGRMVHGKKGGKLTAKAQRYAVTGQAQRAIDRSALSRCFLETLRKLPNVKLYFQHKLVGADLEKGRAYFQILQHETGEIREHEGHFDFLIGADGAYSATRYALMKHMRMNFQQEYLESLWCEFRIESFDSRKARADRAGSKDTITDLSMNHFHIWPAGNHMFIAIPNKDGTFTATLFLPHRLFTPLEGENAATKLVPFFRKHYPGVVPNLMSEQELLRQFSENPHAPLVSVRCGPYHFGSRAVIVGDAAHAMPPFYGQGMNSALEDVRILFEILDKHTRKTGKHHTPVSMADINNVVITLAPSRDWSSPAERDSARGHALAEYSVFRHPDALAINALSLENYRQMSLHVTECWYHVRKWTEEMLTVWAPWLGWETEYARVSFTNMRYSEVRERGKRQGRILQGIASVTGLGSVVAFLVWVLRLKSAAPAHRAAGRTLIWLAGRMNTMGQRLVLT